MSGLYTPITQEEILDCSQKLARKLSTGWDSTAESYVSPDDIVKVNNVDYPRWRTKTHIMHEAIDVLKDAGFVVVSNGKREELETLLETLSDLNDKVTKELNNG